MHPRAPRRSPRPPRTLHRAAACALLTAALTAAPVGAARALGTAPVPTPVTGDAVSLPLPSFGDLLVDPAHQVLYVSGGRTANSVLVLGFDGSVKATVDKEYGADGLALSADGKTLYVAEAAGDAVSAVDTGTLHERARYATPVHTCPSHLARTGARLWIGYGCGDAWNGGVGVLDTAAATPQVELAKQDQQRDVHYLNAPRLAATGAEDSPLAVSEPRLSPATLALYSTEGTALRLRTSAPRGGSNLADLGISSDGGTLFTAAGSQDHVDAFAAPDLADSGAYRTGPSPDALALTPDGKQLAAATQAPNATVTVYPVGASRPTAAYALPDDRIPAAHGLAFAPDGSTLFLISTAPQSTAPQLTVLQPSPSLPTV